MRDEMWERAQARSRPFLYVAIGSWVLSMLLLYVFASIVVQALQELH